LNNLEAKERREGCSRRRAETQGLETQREPAGRGQGQSGAWA
jgi:hypothetical protein